MRWERVGTAFPHLFALHYIKTCLRSHRCASDTQIRIAGQKSTVKQEDPVWKFLKVNAKFIRTICCSLPFYFVWERRSHTSFFSTTPLGFFQLHVHSCLRSLPAELLPEGLK